MGTRLCLPVTTPKSPARARLGDLLRRRRQLNGIGEADGTRRHGGGKDEIAADIEAPTVPLHPPLRGRRPRSPTSAPRTATLRAGAAAPGRGVGPRVLAAGLGEPAAPGTLPRGRIAALAREARERQPLRGARRTGGGRCKVRAALAGKGCEDRRADARHGARQAGLRGERSVFLDEPGDGAIGRGDLAGDEADRRLGPAASMTGGSRGWARCSTFRSPSRAARPGAGRPVSSGDAGSRSRSGRPGRPAATTHGPGEEAGGSGERARLARIGQRQGGAAPGEGAVRGTVAAACRLEHDEAVRLVGRDLGGDRVRFVRHRRGDGARQAVEAGDGTREVAAADGAWLGSSVPSMSCGIDCPEQLFRVEKRRGRVTLAPTRAGAPRGKGSLPRFPNLPPRRQTRGGRPSRRGRRDLHPSSLPGTPALPKGPWSRRRASPRFRAAITAAARPRALATRSRSRAAPGGRRGP